MNLEYRKGQQDEDNDLKPIMYEVFQVNKTSDTYGKEWI